MFKALARIPRLILALTLGRILFVPIIILSFGRYPMITAGALVAFVAVDLYDGVLARSIGADDVPRRALDTVVDRSSVYSVYGWLTATGHLPVALLFALLAREAYCARWAHKLLIHRAIVVKADWLYRTLNLMFVGWVVARPFVAGDVASALFAGVLVYSLPVARDLSRSARLILAMPRYVRSMVIPAGALRALHTVPLSPSDTPSTAFRFI